MCASYFAAYSFGTGIVIGICSASTTICAFGSVSLKTIVSLSGVVMPAIEPPSAFGTPSTALKYVCRYGFATFGLAARSNAYLTSSAVTSRLTGGENFHPFLMCTVTVLLSDETCGCPSASTGLASVAVFGLSM